MRHHQLREIQVGKLRILREKIVKVGSSAAPVANDENRSLLDFLRGEPPTVDEAFQPVERRSGEEADNRAESLFPEAAWKGPWRRYCFQNIFQRALASG